MFIILIEDSWGKMGQRGRVMRVWEKCLFPYIFCRKMDVMSQLYIENKYLRIQLALFNIFDS